MRRDRPLTGAFAHLRICAFLFLSGKYFQLFFTHYLRNRFWRIMAAALASISAMSIAAHGSRGSRSRMTGGQGATGGTGVRLRPGDGVGVGVTGGQGGRMMDAGRMASGSGVRVTC